MKPSRICIWALLALLFPLFPLRSTATTVVPPDFDTLVVQADHIVRAVVKSVNAEWRVDGPNRNIITKVELTVSEVIKGTPPHPLVLELLGGRIGQDELIVDGAPKFKVGEESVLFVQGNGRQVFPLVAIMYGKYPVVRDAGSGTEIVLRSNGAVLYDVSEVSQPMTTEKSAVNAAARPLTPAEFAGKIRAAVNGHAPSTPAHAH